jgi:membrane protein required for colicin V production
MTLPEVTALNESSIVLVDIIILSIITISMLISLIRGFVREALSLAVWILAFWLSWSFFRRAAVTLEPLIDTQSVRLGVAFAAIMLVVLAIGGLINYLAMRLIQRTGLSGSDRFIGMFFGSARGILLVAILVLMAGLTPFPEDDWWQESRLIPYFDDIVVWLRDQLPEDIALKFHKVA